MPRITLLVVEGVGLYCVHIVMRARTVLPMPKKAPPPKELGPKPEFLEGGELPVGKRPRTSVQKV